MGVLAEMVALEQDREGIITQIKQGVEERIQQIQIPGVTHITQPNGDKPHCFLVNIQTILDSPGHILAAEFYSARSQADLVVSAIKNCNTATGIYNRLNEMLEIGAVVINKKAMKLHPVTLDAIREVLAE